jgi:hypothetical protein
MGIVATWHWIVVLVVMALYVVPLAIIIGRTGHSRWWAVLFFIPLVNIAVLWVLALVSWPAVRAERQNSN